MDRKLEIIQELMEQLQGMMDPSAEDFESRLGREKPTVEVLDLESEEPMEGSEDVAMDGDLEFGPEEKLKSRLMKLRG